MTNYREILRLKSLGLNKTEIANAAPCARNTVSTTLERAEACGLAWPLPEGMSDKELAKKLFPSASGKPVFKMLDSAYVHREMHQHSWNKVDQSRLDHPKGNMLPLSLSTL
jgi:hypothetical protein